MPAATPQNWFLPFSSTDPAAPNGDGRPWGDGTEMAARAWAPEGALPRDPWDSGCRVTTFVSGFDAMSAMRDTLETVIQDAKTAPADARGRVYICGWRFNCLRDLSQKNPWGFNDWEVNVPGVQAWRDQSAIGLMLRLMQAGVTVRLLVWLPTALGEGPADLTNHVLDHEYAARLVASESAGLGNAPSGEPLGIVALDVRTAKLRVPSATHHQKMMVIRSVNTHVAFVGGVDLGYTRRDTPARPDWPDIPPGDWQSGEGIPALPGGWPKQPGVDYASLAKARPPRTVAPNDLPATVYGGERQRWHDQHLKLEGPIVATVEWQFGERWRDWGRVYDLTRRANWFSQQVIFSSSAAFDDNGIKLLPIPPPAPSPSGAASRVQMWRTIPLRAERPGPPFARGEFTVMAGVAHAVKTATELIWVFDQYMWSEPFGRLVNAQLKANPGLRVIIVLPPHADVQAEIAHEARRRTLLALTSLVGLNRVGIYHLWDGATAANRGIYVHAKSHTYDAALLVCGSANVNRRSFLCDTELACAVLDPAVVLAHQRALWALLFNGAARPDVDLQVVGGGKRLFDEFTSAVDRGPSILRPDPWEFDSTLPNGAQRRAALSPSPLYSFLYNNVLDPTSVDSALESDFGEGTAPKVPPTLHHLVRRLEHEPGVDGDYPFRKPR